MSDAKPPLRIASKKPLRSDGIGSFYEIYKADERYYPRLEIRMFNGARASFLYSEMAEINFTFLANGEEDITLFVPHRILIRIIGKNFDKLFDALHLCNVKWLRERRDNEQFDPESFYIDRIHTYRIDNWFKTLEELTAEQNRALDEQQITIEQPLPE